MRPIASASLAATIACGCLLFLPLAFGQAGSENAVKPKARVVVTDDNLSEQLPPPAPSDDSGAAVTGQPQPASMNADEVAALEAAIAEKQAKVKDLKQNMAAISTKAEQEADADQKARYQQYVETSQGTLVKLEGELTEMENKLALAKSSPSVSAEDEGDTKSPHSDQLKQ